MAKASGFARISTRAELFRAALGLTDPWIVTLVRFEAMPAFVLLLRGVNAGKAKRLAMGDLRSLLCALQDTNINTLLNSGNAVFRHVKRSFTLTCRHLSG